MPTTKKKRSAATPRWFRAMELACPRCGKATTFPVHDDVPRQTFDVKCCGGQVVRSKVIARRLNMVFRELTWELSK
jgi:hypothetical protein